MNKNSNKHTGLTIFAFLIGFFILSKLIDFFSEVSIDDVEKAIYGDSSLKIIASTENKDLEDVVLNFARNNNMRVSIDYAGTIEIMDKLNSGENYDAVWTSNSIWLYMIDSSKVKIKNSKSTSVNPVVFGITKSKAEELGFIQKEVYTSDIVKAIEERKIKI